MAVYFVYVWNHGEIPRYIGKSRNRYRALRHLISEGHNKPRYEYFQKFSNEMDLRFVLENASYDDACELEEKLCRQYGLLCDNTGSLLNRTYGGKTEERSRSSLQKVSTTMRALGEEHWAKRSEVREKIKQSMLAKFRDLSYREKFNQRMIESRNNPVTREKMSLAKLGKNLSEEHKAKIRVNAHHDPKSDETKQAMRQGQAECWADPERSAKRRASIKAAWADPEKSARRREKLRAVWERKRIAKDHGKCPLN